MVCRPPYPTCVRPKVSAPRRLSSLGRVVEVPRKPGRRTPEVLYGGDFPTIH